MTDKDKLLAFVPDTNNVAPERFPPRRTRDD
jgi:hypothetical protein